ncbi:unnamed protein product [Durusdinium trenchii]|uniref:Dirigent protein n=1 Tax=Durusdinium trenchii TaxID=1381693 RepID=A0ABP0MHW6_9DINO
MRNFNRNGSTTTTAPTGFVPAMHGAGRRAARWIVQLLLLQLVSLWNFSLPLPGRTGGQEPPLPEHGNQFVIDLANELWFAADDMLTAGAFMGDEGWAGRGESPATLGAVGINMRNAAEALLFADWWTVSGELEVAGASGEFYFDEEELNHKHKRAEQVRISWLSLACCLKKTLRLGMGRRPPKPTAAAPRAPHFSG